MRIQQTRDHIGNITDGTAMKIAATAQAFNALSKTLYKNPIFSTIRELCANAYDAHQQNGNEHIPFKITLPTEFISEFCIRDYGIGITHEKMLSLYTTYFSSDKTETDDLIGAYGLGSKTPFSITDTFTIITRTANEPYARHYMAYKDNGIPSLKYIGTMENFSTGTQITFTTSSTSYRSWHDAAYYYLPYYPTIPEHNLHLLKPITSWYEDTHKDINGNYYKLDQNPVIIMGTIPYEIPVEILSKKYQVPSFTVPIGTFTPSISRDSLHLTETDKNTLETLADHYRTLIKNHNRFQLLYAKTIEDLDNIQYHFIKPFSDEHLNLLKQKYPFYNNSSRFTLEWSFPNIVDRKSATPCIERRKQHSNSSTYEKNRERYIALSRTTKIFYGPEELTPTFSRNIKYYIQESSLQGKTVYYVPSERFQYMAEWIRNHYYNVGEPERFDPRNYPLIRRKPTQPTRSQPTRKPQTKLRGWSDTKTTYTRYELLELMEKNPDTYVYANTKLYLDIFDHIIDLSDTYKKIRLINNAERNTKEYPKIREILDRNSSRAAEQYEQHLEKLRQDKTLYKKIRMYLRKLHYPYWLINLSRITDLTSEIGPILENPTTYGMHRPQINEVLTTEKINAIIRTVQKTASRIENALPLIKYAQTKEEAQHLIDYTAIFLKGGPKTD